MFSQSEQALQQNEIKAIAKTDNLDEKLKSMKDANDMYKEALIQISAKHYKNAFKCLDATLQKDASHQKAQYTIGCLSEFATEEGNSIKALRVAVSWYTVCAVGVKESDIAKAANQADLPGFLVPKSVREICPSC